MQTRKHEKSKPRNRTKNAGGRLDRALPLSCFRDLPSSLGAASAIRGQSRKGGSGGISRHDHSDKSPSIPPSSTHPYPQVGLLDTAGWLCRRGRRRSRPPLNHPHLDPTSILPRGGALAGGACPEPSRPGQAKGGDRRGRGAVEASQRLCAGFHPCAPRGRNRSDAAVSPSRSLHRKKSESRIQNPGGQAFGLRRSAGSGP